MPYCVIRAGWVENVSISSYAKGGRELGFYKLMVYEKFLTSENIMIRFLTFIQIELQYCLYISDGGGDFLMSSIWVCATDQGRCFTSETPENAPTFKLFSSNRP